MAGLLILLGMYLMYSWYQRNRKIKLGLDGEVYTGQELNFLMRDGAWVYHDIPYAYGNIDHIVVSKGGVFTVETKARRKPANAKGGRECKVQFQGETLNFGSGSDNQPIQQARRHAEHIGNYLKKRTGNSYPVIPVVALPGWYVVQKEKSDVVVINPKRGGGLRYKVNNSLIPEKEVAIIAQHIEEYARSVESATNRTDPDAHKKYDIFLNRRPEDRKIQ